MNVLITTPSFHGKGGVSYYFRTILPYLNLNNSIDFKISHIEIGGINIANKLFHALNDQLQVYKHISTKMVDLIHVNPSLDPKSLLRDGMFTFLAKRKGIPVIVFFHGWHLPFESLFQGRLKHFWKMKFLKADSFIVLSSAFKATLKKWGVNVPIYIETTTVNDSLISNFSIENKVDKIWNTKETRILFLARLEKDKGIFETLYALNILLGRGNNVSLSIAGDGSAMHAVSKYIKKNKTISGKIKVLGYVRGEDKKAVYSSHHIYCLPTTHGEGMPTSVLEAMIFGLCVVTRPVGGIKDFFENGKMGYTTEKKSPDAIADLIEKLIKNKKQMINIATYNHNYARERFLASEVAIRLKKIYKNVLLKSSLV